jgi:hypothetical protein
MIFFVMATSIAIAAFGGFRARPTIRRRGQGEGRFLRQIGEGAFPLHKRAAHPLVHVSDFGHGFDALVT